jgi:hypothetical protein
MTLLILPIPHLCRMSCEISANKSEKESLSLDGK